MPEPKTRPTDASVNEFVAGVADETRRKDASVIRDLMAEITKEIAGDVGRRHYRFRFKSAGLHERPRIGLEAKCVIPATGQYGALSQLGRLREIRRHHGEARQALEQQKLPLHQKVRQR